MLSPPLRNTMQYMRAGMKSCTKGRQLPYGVSPLEGSCFSAAPFILLYLSHSTVTTWRLVPESFTTSQDYCLMCVYPPSALTVTKEVFERGDFGYGIGRYLVRPVFLPQI